MQSVGSRAQVWHGTAHHTSGGLTKKHLKKFMERDFPEYPKFTYNESVIVLLYYFDELQARLAEYE